MVRTVDYEARKKAVLAATINRYINEAELVSSEDIADEFNLSPATIRNIFVDLEQDGYLSHPYTSGGKMPTDKGYRYYVDFLISQMRLLDQEKQDVIREYQQELSRLEDILEKTSEILSSMTRHTSIVSLTNWHDKFLYKGIGFIFEQPEFQQVERLQLLIRMIEERQALLDIVNRDFREKVKVYIGEELGCPQMDNCSLVVASYGGKNRTLGRVAVLGPVRMQYAHIIPSLEYVSDVLTEMLDERASI